MEKTVTIYASGAQIVQKISGREGLSGVKFPESLVPGSLMILDSQGNPSNSFVLNLPEVPNVEKRPLVSVVKYATGNSFVGNLINLNERQATLEINGSFYLINDYDTLEYLIPKKNSLGLLKSPVSSPVSLNYYFTGLKWGSQMTALIDSETSKLDFFLIARIFNEEKDLQGDITLILGDVNRPQNTEIRPQAMLLRASKAATSSEESEAPPGELEDYIKYPLGILNLPQSTGGTQVPLNHFSSEVQKIYQINTSTDSEGNAPVSHGYRFETPIFLPTGSVNVYQRGGSFLGSASVRNYLVNEPVDLLIGTTTKVKAQINITRAAESDDSEEHQTLRVTLENQNVDQIYLVVRHNLGTLELLESSCPIYQRKGSYVEFFLTVAPQCPLNFECHLRTRGVKKSRD